MKQKRKLLAVGCPRSGSRFFVKLLRNSGFQVGHESFRRDGIVTMFFAVEDCFYPGRHWTTDEDFPEEDESRQHRSDFEFERVWHYVRDPRRVIASIAAKRFQWLLWPWQERHTGISSGLFPLKLRAMRFWLRWNELIEENESIDMRIRMEAIDDLWPGIREELEIPEDKIIPDAYRNYGSVGLPHEQPVPVSWDEMKSLDEATTIKIMSMAERYGYEIMEAL